MTPSPPPPDVVQVKPESTNTIPLGASLFVVFLCMLFGANAVAVKVSLEGVGVFTMAGLRFSIAVLTIMIWAMAAAKPLFLTKKQFVRLVPLGFMFLVQLSCFYQGLARTTAAHGTLIANLLPFIVMILAHFFIPGERISRKSIIGLVLGFSGMVVLLLDRITMTSSMLAGDLIILTAIVIWGCNAIYTKRISVDFHPIQLTVYPMLLAVPGFALGALLYDGVPVRLINGPIVAAIIYQTFVTASFGLLAWTTMVKRYGATTLHAFVFVMPISGVFFGVILLGEPFTINLAGAIILVTAGLLVINTRPRVVT